MNSASPHPVYGDAVLYIVLEQVRRFLDVVLELLHQPFQVILPDETRILDAQEQVQSVMDSLFPLWVVVTRVPITVAIRGLKAPIKGPSDHLLRVGSHRV